MHRHMGFLKKSFRKVHTAPEIHRGPRKLDRTDRLFVFMIKTIQIQD